MNGKNCDFGRNTGVMTRLAIDCPWLIKIHCANQWIELAVKGALDETTSNKCATIYSSNFALLKNSGKMKGEIKAAAQILNMEYYALSKLPGTHFVGHCWNGYMPTPLWFSITIAYESFITDENTRPDTKVKVTVYLIN